MTAVFNVCEGFLWLGLALALAVRSRTATPPTKRLGFVAAAAFAAFAGTDFVEARTGAWYDPPWLLAYNIACIAVLAICFLRYCVLRRRLRAANDRRTAL